jgi:hypothetical protein
MGGISRRPGTAAPGTETRRMRPLTLTVIGALASALPPYSYHRRQLSPRSICTPAPWRSPANCGRARDRYACRVSIDRSTDSSSSRRALSSSHRLTAERRRSELRTTQAPSPVASISTISGSAAAAVSTTRSQLASAGPAGIRNVMSSLGSIQENETYHPVPARHVRSKCMSPSSPLSRTTRFSFAGLPSDSLSSPHRPGAARRCL